MARTLNCVHKLVDPFRGLVPSNLPQALDGYVSTAGHHEDGRVDARRFCNRSQLLPKPFTFDVRYEDHDHRCPSDKRYHALAQFSSRRYESADRFSSIIVGGVRYGHKLQRTPTRSCSVGRVEGHEFLGADGIWPIRVRIDHDVWIYAPTVIEIS